MSPLIRINAAMKAASSASFGYNTDLIVSSDVIGMTYGSLFDATQTMVTKIDDDTLSGAGCVLV